MANIIRKPSEIEAKDTLAMLIYGQPGIGKTTLGVSAPNPLLIDFDGGVNRINAAHYVNTVQPTSWEDMNAALEEMFKREQSGELHFDSIVIDTVGKMLDYMGNYIVAQDSRLGQRDGSLNLKGYGARKTLFADSIKRWLTLGKSVIFIAHEREEKQGDYTVKRPEVGSASNAGDLMKELDLVGYVQMIGKQRTIFFSPQEAFFAKNTCNLPEAVKISTILDEAGNPLTGTDAKGHDLGANDYLTRLIGYYKAQQQKKNVAFQEYEKLLQSINKAAGEASDAEALNGLVDTVESPTLQHYFNSKLVCYQVLDRRAAALGLKRNPMTKRYETVAA